MKIITTEKDFGDHVYRFYKIFFYSSEKIKKIKINKRRFFFFLNTKSIQFSLKILSFLHEFGGKKILISQVITT